MASSAKAMATAGLAALLILAAAGAASAAEPPGIEAADAAFDAGDSDTALRLYDEVLARDPDNVRALVRTGMMLSWRKNYVEAVARYDRALAVEPSNRTAALERAKVLSWDGKYERAAEAFRALLAGEPGDRDARIGLARSLSWGGRQSAAREEYDRILAKDPGDVEALVGRAQTHAWSGEIGSAREGYRRVLAVEPGRREAVIGLGYLDLWTGDPAGAGLRASEVLKRFPGDEDAIELREQSRKARAPWVRSTYDRVDDTDDNELDIWRLEGGFGLPAGLDLTGGVARHDMSGPGEQTATIDSIYAILGVRTGPGQRLSLRLGTDRRENSAGDRDRETIGGIGWAWGQGWRWQGRVSADRDSFRYNAEILDAGVVVDSYAAVVSGRIAGRWYGDAEIGYWDLSADAPLPDNSRRSAQAGVRYRWPVRGLTLDTGTTHRWVDYRNDEGNPYFSPSNFTAHLAQVRGYGRFGASELYWDVLLEGGVQSFRLGPDRVSNDRVLAWTALLGVPVGGGLNLELYGNRSDYALQNATGFTSRQLGVRLRWGATLAD